MRPALGYIVSAASASLAMVIVFGARADALDLFSPGLLAYYFTTWEIAFGLTLVCALPPFLLTRKIAKTAQITSLAFILACACVAAITLCALAAGITEAQLNPQDPDHIRFSIAWLRFFPAFLVGGIAGGATFWICCRETVAR